MKHMSCCFTGHRKIPPEHYDKVVSCIRAEAEALINDGINIFYAGGALGFDIIAEQVIISLKERYKDVRLILALPCKNQTRGWSEKDERLYERIKERCDEYIYVSDEYTRGCMHKRNRFMVDNSCCCICYLTENVGGTSYTVKYAESKGLNVINIAEKLI